MPELILLDINMPKLNGFGFLEEVDKDDKLKIIPVIMLTSSKSDEDIIRSYKGGAVSYLKKPVDFLEFVEMVDGFNFYWQMVSRLPGRD